MPILQEGFILVFVFIVKHRVLPVSQTNSINTLTCLGGIARWNWQKREIILEKWWVRYCRIGRKSVNLQVKVGKTDRKACVDYRKTDNVSN